MELQVGGLLGIVVTILAIWAIIVTLTGTQDTNTKILWVVILILVPLLGVILWWFLYPGRK